MDTTVLTAAQAGDPEAMRQLLLRLRPDIRRYAAYQCGRATAIDDVVQEALIIVHRSLGNVKNLAAFAGWLARVITRLCLLPALRLVRATEARLWADQVPDFWRQPRDDLRMDVVRAIDSLPDSYRAVVIMRDFEELTIGEMAGRLKLTREATKSRLHRARGMLREYLLSGGPSRDNAAH